jgi:hypothetical protein
VLIQTFEILQCATGTLSILEADMQTVHPLTLNINGNVNSQIIALLEQLGVKRLTPRDVISHHILPILRTDAWKVMNSAPCRTG